MKIITMYELLGIVKDGKAPKKIIYDKSEYWYNGLEKDYYKYTTKDYNDEDVEYLFDYKITETLNDTVEILEEEKKIPEKILTIRDVSGKNSEDINHNFSIIWYKMNEIIDCLDYLKSKGDE